MDRMSITTKANIIIVPGSNPAAARLDFDHDIKETMRIAFTTLASISHELEPMSYDKGFFRFLGLTSK